MLVDIWQKITRVDRERLLRDELGVREEDAIKASQAHNHYVAVTLIDSLACAGVTSEGELCARLETILRRKGSVMEEESNASDS